MNGFQSPPVNWTINTKAKQNFFDRVSALTGSSTTTDPPSTGEISVTSLTLITDVPVFGYDPLPGGATLNLATLPTRNLNIRVNTSPATVGSVRCLLDGVVTLTESAAPYACWGDSSGNYRAWTPAVGSHALQATPYSGSNGSGSAGVSLTRSLKVIDQ